MTNTRPLGLGNSQTTEQEMENLETLRKSIEETGARLNIEIAKALQLIGKIKEDIKEAKADKKQIHHQDQSSLFRR